jgi:hypothetical protein
MISNIPPSTSLSYLQESSEVNKPCDCGVCPECTAKSGNKTHDYRAASVSISSEGRLLTDKKKSEEAHRANQEGKASPPQDKNSEEETKQIEELKRRDREVRAHEMAPLMAAGVLASGGPSYEFQKGPDGKQYAEGGEVQIDTSAVEGDPEATMRKGARIQASANAPADPSSQDRSVASQAAAMAVRVQAELAELAEQKKEEQETEVDQSEAHNNPYDKKAESGSIIDLVA